MVQTKHNKYEIKRHILVGCLILFLLVPYISLAGVTGKISGKAIDVATKQPIPSVNILIVGTTMGASTDPQGDYFIANVPIGTYELKASIIGYTPITIRDVRVKADATTEISFSMEQTVLDIGREIVIEAQRPLVEKDNTASTTVVGSEEMEIRPATQLNDILVTIPSINIENGQMKIRGGTLDEVAVMIDGVRARNPLDQTPYMNINLSSIKELEVITGTYNAEYGEAQSGVFNIITKEGGDKYHVFLDFQYTPPGKRHWGPGMYDYSSNLFWEDTHARHLEWWIDNPDRWVDPNGVYGIDDNCTWTPEQAYSNYMSTHKPLNDYEKMASYQTEISLSGPVPEINNAYFFISGKYRSMAPFLGNAYRNRGKFFDGTAKLTYSLSASKKFTFSTFFGNEKASFGVNPGDYSWYAVDFGLNARYAYYDIEGLPESQTDGQTLQFTNLIDQNSMYEIKLSRVHALREKGILPGDPIGWDASSPVFDYVRDVDVEYDPYYGTPIYSPITGGYENYIGYHTLGYWDKHKDNNTEWKGTGFYSNQFNKNWQLKAGFEFSLYNLDHYNFAKPDRIDSNVYRPYQGAVYAQNKLEYGGLIMNVGLRLDFYNPNNKTYSNIFDPLNSPTGNTKTFAQLSPRLGISHPIDEKTVLHFSYGHFFQRGSFGDYGELFNVTDARGTLTTLIVQGTTTPIVLGNRNTRPQKTVAYELGVERNFAEYFLLTVTGYYKDISNLIRAMTVVTPYGGTYNTTANVNYGDVRGIEVSLRKLPSKAWYGSTSAYINFNTQIGITGRSGEPISISVRGAKYGPSGDAIQHNNPRLKFGLYYKTPEELGFLAGIFKNVSLSFDFEAIYPNEKLPQDVFEYAGTNNPNYYGKRYLRPVDKNAKLRIRKDLSLFGGQSNIGIYMQIDNVFNYAWVNFDAFKTITEEDAIKMIDSDFEDLPKFNAAGVLIPDIAKYRNLPRSIFFGASVEL